MDTDFSHLAEAFVMRGWCAAHLDQNGERLVVWDSKHEWLAIVPTELLEDFPLRSLDDNGNLREVIADARR